MYSVCRVVQDSCIQEYMICTVYAEQCRTAVFKNICYVQCMQSRARHLYSRICYVQCMQSSAGKLYSRIYVMYSVCRVVQESCIQEYMLCTLYSRFIEKSEGQLYSTIYVMCTVQCMKNSEGQQYSRIDLCTEYGEQYRTAVFKNICYVQCMESSARRQLYSRIYGIWYVHCTVSVCRVAQDSCIQEYMLCTVYEEQCTTAVFQNIFMAGNEFTRNLPLLGYTHAQNIYIIMECTDTHSDTQT